MELRRYLGVLRRRLWLVVALLLIGAILGDLGTSQKTSYSAAATIYVGSSNFGGNSAQGAASAYTQGLFATLIPTYEQMLQSQPVAADAAKRSSFGLTAAEVLAHTTVTNQTGTTLLTVTAVDSNPSIAEALANGVANAFTAKILALGSQPGQGAIPSAPAYVFQQATLPTTPQPTKAFSNIIKGGLVGLVLGVGLAGLLEYLDVTVKGPGDAELRLELAVLGVIPLRRTDA